MGSQSDAERCVCELVSGPYKSLPVSAWAGDDTRQQEKKWKAKNSDGVSRRTTVARTQRHGYETLEDKYRFKHHLNLSRYMEDYRNIFSVAVRCNKKGWQPVPPQYKTVSRQQFAKLKEQFENHQALPPNDSMVSNSVNLERASDRPQDSPVVLEREDDSPQIDLLTSHQNLHSPAKHEENAKEIKPPLSSLTAAPPMSAGVDYSKDMLEDESEDDKAPQTPAVPSTPKVPLLKHLNTFFLSRKGRRRTTHSHNYQNGTFPRIKSQTPSPNVADMTATSLINYQTPVPLGRPTSHPTTFIKANDSHHPMFMSMQDRQQTLNLPVRMKMVHSAESDNKMAASQKKFSSHSLKNPEPERTLPSNHILKAKTLSNRQESITPEGAAVPLKTKAKPRDKPSSSDDSNVELPAADSKTPHRQTLHHMILNYSTKSLHHHLPDIITNPPQSLSTSYGKAELVDYGSIFSPGT